MHCIQEKNEALFWGPSPSLELGAQEIRVEIHATAVNRADLVQRQGLYPPPKGASPILGLECAGVVKEVGEAVAWPSVGDRVCALLSGGGYADEVVFPAGHALPIPSSLGFAEAAALPEVFTTAWLNLKLEGQLKPGERVLVHAGGSGVGTAAIQLCRLWGNPVVVTVGSDEKAQRCLSLGAELALNRREGPWGIKARESGKFDVILDPVGGAYLESNIHALNPGGRLINIGLLGGRVGTLPLGPLLVKRLSIRGSVLRSRSDTEKAEILSQLREDIWESVERGDLHPVIDSKFPIQEVEQAHEKLNSNKTFGKVILEVRK